MNKHESSAIPESQDSSPYIDLTSTPLDAPSPDVKSLVSAEAEVPAVSLQPTAEQQSVAAAHPVGEIIVQPAPRVKRRPFRRPHMPHLRQVNVPVKVHTFDSFSYREYRFLWASSLFFSAGFWLQQVIIGWLTYQLTGSALLTSLAMGLDALPILLAGPLGGVLVDAWDKRKLLTFIFAYQSVLTLSFGGIVIGGYVQAWHIFGYIFMMGISWVIADPARMSLIPIIVPKQNLVNAFSLNSMAFSITRLAAPAAGGAILAFAGSGPALLIEAAMLITASVMVLGMRSQPAVRTDLRLRSALREVLEGARYVKSQRIILGIFLFGFIPPVLIIPFLQGMIPVYAAEVFQVGPTTLGLLMSSVGAGFLTGTIVLASMGDVRRKGRIAIVSVGLASIAMAAFALNLSVEVAMVILALGSISTMCFFSTAQATIQSILPNEIRGRVSGIYILTFGMMPAGSLVAGAIAQSFGAPVATLIASGLVAAATMGLALSFKEIWRLE